MTIRRFYELSLFVPLVVPLLMVLADLVPGGGPGWSGTPLLAVPYLGLVYFARRRMRRVSEPELVKLSLRAAFLCVGLACLSFVAMVGGSAFTGGSSADRFLGVCLALLGAGEYVLLVDGVLLLCYLARLVRRERAVAFL